MTFASWLDLRFAARQLIKNPGFTLVAVLTLALGIGANTAMFSLVEGVLLRPLDYRDPERLVRVFDAQLERGQNRVPVAFPNYLDWKSQSTSFEDLGAQHYAGYNLTGRGEARRVNAMRVTANLFPLLGVAPALGRGFTEVEETPGRHRVAVVSHEFWAKDLGRDPAVIGQTLELDAEIFEVVGVMPSGFRHPSGRFELWTPAALEGEERTTQRGSHSWEVVGRLKRGVTLEQAQSELSVIAARLAAQYEDNRGLGVALAGLHDEMVGGTRRALWVLLGGVFCVLLIACANVANLLLARTATRQREFAVRAALGAGRGRLATQLVTEHVLLALIGGGWGVLVAWWGVAAFVAWGPGDLPRLSEVRVNPTVLGFSFALSLATGLLFGVVPVCQAMKVDVNDALKDTVRGSTEGSRRHRARAFLVVAEVALSLVLLAGAGLLLRSFLKLNSVDPGFQPQGVLTADLAVPERKYPSPERQAALILDVLERVRAMPGVSSASAVFGLPLGRMGAQTTITVEGRPAASPGNPDNAGYHQVASGYFRTLQTPFVAGRDFGSGDTTNAVRVVIVNQAFVREFYPGVEDRAVLGRRLNTEGTSPEGWTEIVGVVADMRQRSLTEPPNPEMYFPLTQRCWGFVSLVVRTAADPALLAGPLKQAVAAVDASQPVDRVQPLSSLVDENLAARRLQTGLLGGFAVLALLLAALGVYGVMAYAVARRTQEIGIRLALGAQWRDVIGMVLSQGMRMVGIGVALGLLVGLLVARFLASLLYEVGPHDPTTFGVVTLVLSGVALAACWIPARRASRVAPMEALRGE
ncbi:MAG: ABC transporter permease [Verrucomicrobiales bacterium]|nr:ABC transporter permease [Verrucomicrobiales bacterium]